MAPSLGNPERSGVRVFPDLDALSRAAADLFRDLAGEAISTRGRFTVGLSGGETPKGLYSLLAGEPYAREINWNHVHLFWADERCVPPDHAESNFGLVQRLLLSRIAIPEKNIHRIRGELAAAEAAVEYENTLRNFFGEPETPLLDLIILGIGSDGHTASLFPGSPALRGLHSFALPVSPGEAKWDRVTLTLPILNHTRHVLFLVSGQSKAAVIERIIRMGNPDGLPAGLVRPSSDHCLWFLDKEAAVKLEQGKQ